MIKAASSNHTWQGAWRIHKWETLKAGAMRCQNSSTKLLRQKKNVGKTSAGPQGPLKCSRQSWESPPERGITNAARGERWEERNKLVQRIKSICKYGNITGSSARSPQHRVPADAGRKGSSFLGGRDSVELSSAPGASLWSWQVSRVFHTMPISLLQAERFFQLQGKRGKLVCK